MKGEPKLRRVYDVNGESPTYDYECSQSCYLVMIGVRLNVDGHRFIFISTKYGRHCVQSSVLVVECVNDN